MDSKKVTDAEIAAARREYYRRWRAEHKENIRRHNRNYWRKKALQAQEKARREGEIQ